MWNSAYCFKVTVHQISAELCPFENFGNFFCFQFTALTVYIQSNELPANQYMCYILLLATGQ